MNNSLSKAIVIAGLVSGINGCSQEPKVPTQYADSEFIEATDKIHQITERVGDAVHDECVQTPEVRQCTEESRLLSMKIGLDSDKGDKSRQEFDRGLIAYMPALDYQCSKKLLQCLEKEEQK